MRKNLVIVIFPYLFLDKEEEIDLGKYKLYPSYKSLFDQQSIQVKAHIRRLTSSFSYGQYTSIRQYLFGCFRVGSEKEWEDLKDVLDIFSTVIGYSELSETNGGGSLGNFTYAAFEIVRPIKGRKQYYYQGWINGKSEFQIHYPDTKYKPNYHIGPHVLYEKDYAKKLLSHLYWYHHFITLEERKRILRALSWFNRSHDSDPETDDIERFTALCVAFECLFNSSNEAVQSQLLTGITALLGESDEMKDWVKKFYAKRSKIIHGQEENNTLYTGSGSSTPHIDHIPYARKVFARCIKVIIESREVHYVQDLHQSLISNERRLNDISSALKKVSTMREVDPKTSSLISSLGGTDASGSVKIVISVGASLLKLLDYKKITGDVKLLRKYRSQILSFSGNEYGDLALLYSEFSEQFRPIYYDDSRSNGVPLFYRGAVYSFCSYASWRLFREAFNKKRKGT